MLNLSLQNKSIHKKQKKTKIHTDPKFGSLSFLYFDRYNKQNKCCCNFLLKIIVESVYPPISYFLSSSFPWACRVDSHEDRWLLLEGVRALDFSSVTAGHRPQTH